MKQVFRFLACAVVLGLVVAPAQAHEKGDWVVRGGVGMVSPDNPVWSETEEGATAFIDVDDGVSLTIDATYMMSPNLGLDILAAWPFTHDIKLGGAIEGLAGSAKVAETKHLPPTFSLQYHFSPDAKFQPYVGVGLNYTTFFDVSVSELGLDAGITDLDIDDSFGFAAQFGADIMVSDSWFVNLDIRYINIEPDATVTIEDEGTLVVPLALDINPWVFIVSIGATF